MSGNLKWTVEIPLLFVYFNFAHFRSVKVAWNAPAVVGSGITQLFLSVCIIEHQLLSHKLLSKATTKRVWARTWKEEELCESNSAGIAIIAMESSLETSE